MAALEVSLLDPFYQCFKLISTEKYEFKNVVQLLDSKKILPGFIIMEICFNGKRLLSSQMVLNTPLCFIAGKLYDNFPLTVQLIELARYIIRIYLFNSCRNDLKRCC